jgi:hypothetical protein
VVVAVERKKHRCQGRWPPSLREERRKPSLREEAFIDVPRRHPCPPHRHEHEPVAHPTVLGLGEDAREVLQDAGV